MCFDITVVAVDAWCYSSQQFKRGNLLKSENSPNRQILAQGIPFHYGWIIVGAGGMACLVNSSIRISFGVFIDPLVEELYWSRGATSLAFSLQFICLGLFGVLAGWILEHYGLRKTMQIGAFLFTIGMVFTGLMDSLWQFYLAYGVIIGAAMSFFSTPVITTVTLWFKKKRGFAGGIVWGLQGMGPVVMAPILRYVIGAFSWEQAFIITGLVGGSVMLLMSFLVHSKPWDIGLLPYGQSKITDGADGFLLDGKIDVNESQFFRKVIKTPTFWYLTTVHFLGCISHSLILIHIVSMATLSGLGPLVAAGTLSILVAASVISRFSMSVMTDVISSKGVMYLSIAIQSVSILGLFFVSGAWSYYLVAAIFGFGYGGEMVGFPFINREYYGNAPVGRVYGLQMFGACLGMGIGGWAGGAIFDWTGAYTLGIVLAVVTGFMSLILIAPVKPPSKQQLKIILAPEVQITEVR